MGVKKMKNKQVLGITIIIIAYVLFLNIELKQKIKIILAGFIISFISLVSMPLYTFLIIICFILLIFNTYKDFGIDINEIGETITEIIE